MKSIPDCNTTLDKFYRRFFAEKDLFRRVRGTIHEFRYEVTALGMLTTHDQINLLISENLQYFKPLQSSDLLPKQERLIAEINALPPEGQLSLLSTLFLAADYSIVEQYRKTHKFSSSIPPREAEKLSLPRNIWEILNPQMGKNHQNIQNVVLTLINDKTSHASCLERQHFLRKTHKIAGGGRMGAQRIETIATSNTLYLEKRTQQLGQTIKEAIAKMPFKEKIEARIELITYFDNLVYETWHAESKEVPRLPDLIKEEARALYITLIAEPKFITNREERVKTLKMLTPDDSKALKTKQELYKHWYSHAGDSFIGAGIDRASWKTQNLKFKTSDEALKLVTFDLYAHLDARIEAWGSNTTNPTPNPVPANTKSASIKPPQTTTDMNSKYTDQPIATPTLINGQDVSEMTSSEVMSKMRVQQQSIETLERLPGAKQNPFIKEQVGNHQDALSALNDRLASFATKKPRKPRGPNKPKEDHPPVTSDPGTGEA